MKENQAPYRAPRIQGESLENILFELKTPSGPFQASIANISFSGVGLKINEKIDLPLIGETLSGTLNFLEKNFLMEIRLVHVSATVAGFVFLNPSAEFRVLLKRYFELELEAASLIKINSNVLAKVSDGEPHCYYGANNCEIYYVLQSGNLVRAELTFFGNFVEILSDKSVKTGKLAFDDESDGHAATYPRSDVIEWEKERKLGLIDAAIRFLTNVKGLPPEIVTAIKLCLLPNRPKV